MNNSTEIIPFGKYKGQPVEVLSQDKQYLDWLMQQDWFNTRYASIKTLIINNFREPSETPEHNKIQAMFTDSAFCFDFIRSIRPMNSESLRYCTIRFLREIEDITVFDLPENYRLSVKDIMIRFKGCQFECEGVDVAIFWEIAAFGYRLYSDFISVEIKPNLSDDYPAVLRQMKTNKSEILLTESFSGVGATLDQVRSIFKTANKKIVLLSEIKNQ